MEIFSSVSSTLPNPSVGRENCIELRHNNLFLGGPKNKYPNDTSSLIARWNVRKTDTRHGLVSRLRNSLKKSLRFPLPGPLPPREGKSWDTQKSLLLDGGDKVGVPPPPTPPARGGEVLGIPRSPSPLMGEVRWGWRAGLC